MTQIKVKAGKIPDEVHCTAAAGGVVGEVAAVVAAVAVVAAAVAVVDTAEALYWFETMDI